MKVVVVTGWDDNISRTKGTFWLVTAAVPIAEGLIAILPLAIIHAVGVSYLYRGASRDGSEPE